MINSFSDASKPQIRPEYFGLLGGFKFRDHRCAKQPLAFISLSTILVLEFFHFPDRPNYTGLQSIISHWDIVGSHVWLPDQLRVGGCSAAGPW